MKSDGIKILLVLMSAVLQTYPSEQDNSSYPQLWRMHVRPLANTQSHAIVEYYVDEDRKVRGYSYYDPEEKKRRFFCRDRGDGKTLFKSLGENFIFEWDKVDPHKQTLYREWLTYQQKKSVYSESYAWLWKPLVFIRAAHLKQEERGSSNFTYYHFNDGAYSRALELSKAQRVYDENGRIIGLECAPEVIINHDKQIIEHRPRDDEALQYHQDPALSSLLQGVRK